VFLYGGDAQAGRPASLTYGAVARIAAQELEYEGDAAGGAVDRIFRRCRRTVGSNRCGSTGTRSRSRLCLRFRGTACGTPGGSPQLRWCYGAELKLWICGFRRTRRLDGAQGDCAKDSRAAVQRAWTRAVGGHSLSGCLSVW